MKSLLFFQMLTYHGFILLERSFLKIGLKKGPNFNVAKFGYANPICNPFLNEKCVKFT